MVIKEVILDDFILEQLIAMSKDWEIENSCYGYRGNDKSDIIGNRIFIAIDSDEIIGYLFGHVTETKKDSSIIPVATKYFELLELYVKPLYRSKGIGSKLFKFMENELKEEIEYVLLSTATKNYKAILHFYIDELEMHFWNARLFKKIK